MAVFVRVATRTMVPAQVAFVRFAGSFVLLFALSRGRGMRPRVESHGRLLLRGTLGTVAILFLIFDVEIVFIYPVATMFKQTIAGGSGVLAFCELGFFMAVLLLGLAYVWKKGDLQWFKRV